MREVVMPTPGFPPDVLDEDGEPSWISALACSGPHHAVHVVRDLEPATALERLGAKAAGIRPGALPAARPDELTSLPAASLGADAGGAATLTAGRIGSWTFVYDDSAITADRGPLLSVGGRIAATGRYTINADAGLTYAADGETVAWITVDDLDLEADLPGLPAELRAAFESAGTFDDGELDPGEPDPQICMRAVCALAGLHCTIEDLREIPLLIAVFP
ncbi:hypothetical protein QRX60_29500 [Amycolatopsis mongoliensis]|uniref:Uncharacterized protein n=1 Tax=Amycolatopsis mongoliensis TaxID=715475 RepID=A0A9Y2NB81_9PSEU|nr:hypothetical protein [Amycolatopsis sp. 4-36]WIX98201.1 hypothetical protein QRX60_29500 [Amycolatopsis sp. 4-36]